MPLDRADFEIVVPVVEAANGDSVTAPDAEVDEWILQFLSGVEIDSNTDSLAEAKFAARGAVLTEHLESDDGHRVSGGNIGTRRCTGLWASSVTSAFQRVTVQLDHS